MAAVEAVELGPDLVLGAFADRVTGQAFVERGVAGGGILGQRGGCESQRCDGRQRAQGLWIHGVLFVSSRGLVNRLWHVRLAEDKPRNFDRFHDRLLVRERTRPPGGGYPGRRNRCRIGCFVVTNRPRAKVPRETPMSIMMPAADQAVLNRRGEIVAALRAIVPGEGVIDSAAEMLAYESDGLTAYRQPPMVVVLPDTTEQVSQVLKYCFEQRIKVVPRGAGTSLSGGALPLADGVLLGLGKFKRIREIDFANRVVVTEPGVTNLAISEAVASAGFYYAPDPSSQIACSIGGNVAENSGGVHCLKYGMTTNNVLGCEIVLMSGEILKIGGKSAENAGYDLMGIITGSEGLLGVITEITVRILQKPETARALMVGFAEVEAAGQCVARIIGAGIIPGGMEMMDRPAIHAAEAFVHAGYPLDVEALLIIELDG